MQTTDRNIAISGRTQDKETLGLNINCKSKNLSLQPWLNACDWNCTSDHLGAYTLKVCGHLSVLYP